MVIVNKQCVCIPTYLSLSLSTVDGAFQLSMKTKTFLKQDVVYKSIRFPFSRINTKSDPHVIMLNFRNLLLGSDLFSVLNIACK